jgi:hypothetical protein
MYQSFLSMALGQRSGTLSALNYTFDVESADIAQTAPRVVPDE